MKEYKTYLDTPNITPSFGLHCFKPKQCELFNTCWPSSKTWDIFKLSQVSLQKKLDYYQNNIITFANIKKSFETLTTLQKEQINVEQTGIAKVDKLKVTQFLDQLTSTFHCLDIEVLQVAIPQFKPYKTYFLFFSSLH